MCALATQENKIKSHDFLIAKTTTATWKMTSITDIIDIEDYMKSSDKLTGELKNPK